MLYIYIYIHIYILHIYIYIVCVAVIDNKKLIFIFKKGFKREEKHIRSWFSG